MLRTLILLSLLGTVTIIALIRLWRRNPTPRFEKARAFCPFYRFFSDDRNMEMREVEDNRCALLKPVGTSCAMEKNEQSPNWHQCICAVIDADEVIEKRKGWRVYAIEFWPVGRISWKGIRFKAWMKYVMGPQPPLPSKPLKLTITM